MAGLGLAAVPRRTAGTVLAAVTAVLVLPLLLTEDRHWRAVARHALIFPAWLRLTATGPEPVAFPWTRTGAWTVYAVWAVAAAGVSLLAVRRRDV